MPGTRGTRRVARWGGNATASAFSSSRARVRAGSAPTGPARSVPPLARRVAPRHAHRTARPDLSSPPPSPRPHPRPVRADAAREAVICTPRVHDARPHRERCMQPISARGCARASTTPSSARTAYRARHADV
ncbi:hypothetical protein K525DRAFT_275306 [Schizophyllum commune Loenen D]|nr:hypothetical protein K525DRAFT_275306 [Schizophyllum commune Loenen D]